MEEIWKDVEGFEGLYQISSRGRLKSFKQYKEGKILRLTNKKGGYFSFVLQGIGHARRSVRIHRLVATAFIPNPDNLPQVNHIDGNKQNNAVENLEWCTASENHRHALKQKPEILQGMIRYNKYNRPRTVIQFSKYGRPICRFLSAKEAQLQTGICARNILQVANRTPFNPKGFTRKTAGGYIWRFADEKGGE